MIDPPVGTIGEHFAAMDDPRVARTRRHESLDILTIARCGVICGAESWVEVEQFGNEKLEWLRTFLTLPRGIPSHDTFGRMFARLDSEPFQGCFVAWVRDIVARCLREVLAPKAAPGARSGMPSGTPLGAARAPERTRRAGKQDVPNRAASRRAGPRPDAAGAAERMTTER